MQPVFRIRPHPRGSAQDAHPAAGSRLPCGLASRLLSGSAADRVRAAGVGPRWGTGFVSPPSRPSHSRLSPPGGAGSTWFSDLPSDGRDPPLPAAPAFWIVSPSQTHWVPGASLGLRQGTGPGSLLSIRPFLSIWGSFSRFSEFNGKEELQEGRNRNPNMMMYVLSLLIMCYE